MNKKIVILSLISFLLAGCAGKQMIKPDVQKPVAQESQEEPSIRFTDWQNVPEMKIMHFSYDKSDLMPQAREILKKNAKYILANPDLTVLIEGYCDERGTQEYNLALGQRRASAVRDYYGKLGVPLSNMGTISYGLEKPIDPSHNESAWAMNRRVETKVRSKKPDTLEHKATEIRK